MSVHVIMPQMGESVAEGTVVRWLKKPGERVERDEPLLEISTDKVDAEIPSPAAGVLSKVLVKENETVEVNTVIAEIESDAVAAPAAPAPGMKTPAPTAQLAAGIHPSQPVRSAPSAEPIRPVRPAQSGGKVRSSPLVRKMALEHKLDLILVPGTGLGGRISKKDVMAYLSRPTGKAARAEVEAPVVVRPSPVAPAIEPTPSGPPAAAIEFTSPTKVVPMTPMRRQIAEHMVTSKHTAPHVATVFEVEMTKVAQTMAACGPEFERRNGIKLTYTPFLIRAVVNAIKLVPIVNSSVGGGNIIYKRDVNIGVAVALDTGLIVPVMKRADEKNFLGIARSLHDLAVRARAKRLSVDDVQDGTFTISNHGIFGSLIGTPVISQPQVAVLAAGKIEKRPVVRDDAIAIRTMVYLTLSFDHRVLDGAVADQFMSHLKSKLENWEEPVL